MSDVRGMAKYLDRYAESVVGLLEEPSGGAGFDEPFDAAAVVPVFDESTERLEGWLTPQVRVRRSLLVVVVNQREDAPPAASGANVRLRNAIFERALRSRGVPGDILTMHHLRPSSGQNEVASLTAAECTILLVDATRPPLVLAKGEGVGKARKWGFDLATALFARGRLLSPMVGSIDADVLLPSSYFATLCQPQLRTSGSGKDTSGILFPYMHERSTDPQLDQAMIRLEMSFRYHVLALARAGSPFAYHSLGSAFAVSLPHYAGVRGFPNRQAGEDFHLLRKLSKVAPLRRISAPVVRIETRLSARAPFGTGQSLKAELEAAAPGDLGNLVHSPQAYELLAEFIQSLEQCTAELSSQFVWRSSTSDVPLWLRSGADLLWQKVLPQLRECPTAQHRRTRVHEQFDALQTYQFLHSAERDGCQRIPVRHALAQVGLLSGEVGDHEGLLQLRALEDQLPGAAGLSSGKGRPGP